MQKKRFSETTNYSVHIRTQINIDPVHFTFSPENNATFARSLTVISLCDLFWYDLLSLPKVTGYNLYDVLYLISSRHIEGLLWSHWSYGTWLLSCHVSK